MATWVTGDLHGAIDFHKLPAFVREHRGEVGEGDRLVVLGDFGLVWGPRTLAQEDLLSWLDASPWAQVLFVDGNHEDFDQLASIPVEEGWHGGRVQRLPGHPDVVHLLRGEIYDMGEDGTWLAMGGARSTDRDWRIEHVSWWPQELPGEEDRRRCKQSLELVGWRVDHVLTHDGPAGCLAAIAGRLKVPPSMVEVDAYENWLQWLDDRLTFRKWWFGHWHVDMDLDERHACLYDRIVRMEGE